MKVSIAAERDVRATSTAVFAVLAGLALAVSLLSCNGEDAEPSPGAGGPVPAGSAATAAEEGADAPVLLVDGLLNGGFELLADGTTDPPKYGAYWSGAFAPEPGEPTCWVGNDRPFRGERLLRLSHVTTEVHQKIVADPRWTAALSVSLAVRTYRGGQLLATLEDGDGLSVTVRVSSEAGVLTVLDEQDTALRGLISRPGEDDWTQLVLPLGALFSARHGHPPMPCLLLRLDADGPTRALVDVDEVHANVSWPAQPEGELVDFTRALVRWTLDTWYQPRASGGLGLVDPETGYVRYSAYNVETGAPGAAPRNVSFHTIHNLLLLWLAESRRRGWDEEVARWTPALDTITTSLLDHNFDERTGLPRNVSADDLAPSDDAVTVGNYVEFLADARELVDDAALAERCLTQARRIADTLVALQREHDIPPDSAPPPPVWNEQAGHLVGDTSNWFGHVPDRLTPQGEVEIDQRFRTSWAILTGRTFWYEMMRSPRAILRVSALDSRPGDLAAVARAIESYHRDWDASRYDLENDTDDHYGYLCEDLLAPLARGGTLLPQALGQVQAATDHRLARDATDAGDTLWIQAVRLGTACAGDSPRAFAGPLELYRMSPAANPASAGLALYHDALLELARNDLQGRQLSNAQFTESFFKDWEMVCICFRGTFQGDCRHPPPEGWHGDVGDTFGGPPTSAIDAQTAAYRVATDAERPALLAALGLVRHVTETTLRRQYGYLFGLDEAVARRYELPDKYVHALQPVTAAGMGYVMAWMRLLPYLSDAPAPPRAMLDTPSSGVRVSGAPGQLVALVAQRDPIPAPVSARDARMLALDLDALEGGLGSAPRVTLGADGAGLVPLAALGLGGAPGPAVIQPLLLDPDDGSVLAVGAPISPATPDGP